MVLKKENHMENNYRIQINLYSHKLELHNLYKIPDTCCNKA